jgi:sodium transport system permease protein
MNWRNIGLIFRREVVDQLRDRRTLFMIAVLPLLLYPALGIGMVQLTVLFSEQPRTVVILGAAALPEPPLLQGNRFRPEWFRDPEDARTLRVVTDQDAEPRPEHQPLLAQARSLREKIEQRRVVAAQLHAAERSADAAAQTELRRREAELTESLEREFAASGIQVLIVVPPTLAADLAALRRELARQGAASHVDYPRPVLLQNSADEKSLIAAGRTRQVLEHWEREILRQTLRETGLPENLPEPVQPAEIDLAQEEQISANVWSKLFPALLVIMALTGAFYPAIDLGAGEKERGTMETLLICPATRSEIVLGKFFTVMLFSVTTALLNLGSLGLTGKYMVSLAETGPMSRMGDLSLPPLASLAWVVVFLLPLAALFSALCLAFAMFARSTKEGQYYLTPLLMVTLGLTMFCLSPAVEMEPFYSVVPIMGPALLLKGLLLANHQAGALYLYAVPVLIASLGYSLLALWWAIDQFGSEDVLFRAAERFEVRLWLRHLLRDKEPTPSFAEALFCFVLIMLLQFAALKAMQTPLRQAAEADRSLLMLQLLIIQQLVFIATPAMLMGVMLTTSVRETFQLHWPEWRHLAAAVCLAASLHPLSLEFARRMEWFFPPLPPSVTELVAAMSHPDLPWWLPLLAFAAAPAVCEEVAFRGFMLSGFRHSGRAGLAIVLSAALFGLMHLIPQQVLNASLLGLVLGVLAVRGRSLFPAIVFHFLFNGLEVCRVRYGQHLPQHGAWGLLFRWDGSLLYQPLLLLTALVVASVSLWLLIRQPDRRASLLSSFSTEQFAMQKSAGDVPPAR